MAKLTLILEDIEDNAVSLRVEGDTPVILADSSTWTNAQRFTNALLFRANEIKREVEAAVLQEKEPTPSEIN